jgi:5'-nucleotidase
VLEQQRVGANAALPRILLPSSSLTYNWENNIAAGNRVSNIRVSGVAINLASTYCVTFNSFLADGSNGFAALLAGTNR